MAMLILCSELALLLVAMGDSTMELLERPLPLLDLTLYKDDAGTFDMKDLKPLGVLFLMSMCLNAMSRDFFDRFRPNPVDSRTEGVVDFKSCIGLDLTGFFA